MEPFRMLDAVAAPLPAANVDTDQILPARFLFKARKEGFAAELFGDLRQAARAEGDAFLLDRPEYRDARILVADRNFGCGSSREHAIWALWDAGIRTVLAPSFGDIFFNNALKNGLLPVVLPEARIDELLYQLRERPGRRMVVDLAAQTVDGPDGRVDHFEIAPLSKECLLEGLDDIELTLRYRDRIDAFEKQHERRLPWL
jgi:3-isopropylmalate/(R)-2-methylmalate dehydratase small subunit